MGTLKTVTFYELSCNYIKLNLQNIDPLHIQTRLRWIQGGDNCLNNGFFANNEIKIDCLGVLFDVYITNVVYQSTAIRS